MASFPSDINFHDPNREGPFRGSPETVPRSFLHFCDIAPWPAFRGHLRRRLMAGCSEVRPSRGGVPVTRWTSAGWPKWAAVPAGRGASVALATNVIRLPGSPGCGTRAPSPGSHMTATVHIMVNAATYVQTIRYIRVTTSTFLVKTTEYFWRKCSFT